jgi:hypothetical protein
MDLLSNFKESIRGLPHVGKQISATFLIKIKSLKSLFYCMQIFLENKKSNRILAKL